MLKDLKFDPVSGVEVAIAKTPEKTGESTFYLYIINHKEVDLKNILVMTEAEEKEDGSGRKTSKLRHFFELLAEVRTDYNLIQCKIWTVCFQVIIYGCD